jgi:hypothetical protein
MALTNPFTRRRHSPNNVIVPGRAKIPPPDPGPGLSFQVAPAPFYQFVPGDLFEPGTGNWALLPTYETPLNTTWGHGFALLNQPRTSHIFGPVQTYSHATVTQWFFRGMPAAQFALGDSLQIDVATGQTIDNPIDPTSGMAPPRYVAGEAGLPWGGSGDFGPPPLSVGPPAGLSFGYSGDGGTDGLTGE